MKYYTTREVAAELDVAPKTILRWRKTGILIPETRTGGGWCRYSVAQIKAAKKGIFSNITPLLENDYSEDYPDLQTISCGVCDEEVEIDKTHEHVCKTDMEDLLS